jgi:hypothetical protein
LKDSDFSPVKGDMAEHLKSKITSNMKLQIKTCLNIPNNIRLLVVSLPAVFFLASASGQETLDFIPYIQASPNAIVSLQGTDGNFYGTTYWCIGAAAIISDTVFQMTPAGALTKC